MSTKQMFRPMLAIIAAFLIVPLLAVTSESAVAQTSPGQQPGIVATGYGRVSSPAAFAEVQVLVGRDVYGGMSYGMTDVEVGASAASPVPAGAEDGYAAYGQVNPPSLTAEDVAPIVDVIVGAGVPLDEIQIIIPAFTSMYSGPGGLGGAQLRFSVADPTLEDLTTLESALNAAALSAGTAVQHIGVHYVGGDCAAMEQEARVQAVADAQARAEGLAVALGTTLGELLQAADNLYYGMYGEGGGCEAARSEDYGPYGPGMLPAFDAATPAEAVSYAQVTLTFAMGPSAGTG